MTETPRTVDDAIGRATADLVSVARDFVDAKADDVFVYGSMEATTLKADMFFALDGSFYERHELASAPEPLGSCDTDIPRQRLYVRELTKVLRELHEVCKAHDWPRPTELKVHFAEATRTVRTDVDHDVKWFGLEGLTPSDVFAEWVRSVRGR